MTILEEISRCLERYGPLTVDELADYVDKPNTTIRCIIDKSLRDRLRVIKIGKGSNAKNLYHLPLPQHTEQARARKDGIEKEAPRSRILTHLGSGPRFLAQLKGLAALPVATFFTNYYVLLEERRIGRVSFSNLGSKPFPNLGSKPYCFYYLTSHKRRAGAIEKEIKEADFTRLLEKLFSLLEPHPRRLSQLAEITHKEPALLHYVLSTHVGRQRVRIAYVPTRDGAYAVYYLPRDTEQVEARLAEHGFLRLPDKCDEKVQERKLNFFWVKNSDWILQLLQKRRDGGYIRTTDALLPLLPYLSKAIGKPQIYLQKEIIIRTLIGHFIHASEDPTPLLEEWGVPKRLIARILSDIKKYR